MTVVPTTQSTRRPSVHETGLGILVPVSPLSSRPLSLADRQHVELDEFSAVIDGVLAESTQVVPVVQAKPRLTADEVLARAFTWLSNATRNIGEALRDAVHWLTAGVAPAVGRIRSWWRERRAVRSYAGRHHVRFGGIASHITVHKMQYERAARERTTEGNLPGFTRTPNWNRPTAAVASLGSLQETRRWFEFAIQAIRDYDDARRLQRMSYETEGYQFRCS